MTPTIEPPAAICQVERLEVGNARIALDLPLSTVKGEMIVRRDQLTTPTTIFERHTGGNWTLYTVRCSKHNRPWSKLTVDSSLT